MLYSPEFHSHIDADEADLEREKFLLKSFAVGDALFNSLLPLENRPLLDETQRQYIQNDPEQFAASRSRALGAAIRNEQADRIGQVIEQYRAIISNPEKFSGPSSTDYRY